MKLNWKHDAIRLRSRNIECFLFVMKNDEHCGSTGVPMGVPELLLRTVEYCGEHKKLSLTSALKLLKRNVNAASMEA